MKLKDFIVLAIFTGLIGCGQSHQTGSNPHNTGASGQAVPNPNESVDDSEPNDPSDTETEPNPESDPDTSDASDPADAADSFNPSDPTDASETDETATTDISDPSETTDNSDVDLSESSDAEDPADTEPETGPLETPVPGTYSHERIPLGGFESAVRASFHPSGDYAVVLSQYDTVHVYDWATQTNTVISVGSNNKMQLADVVFAADGSSAWIAATNIQNGTSAQILRFDDATYRAQTHDSDPSEIITTFTTAMSGKSTKAIALPWDGSFPIAAFESGQSGNYIWTLRNFHPDTGEFEELYTSTNAEAPAEDLAIVNNEFGTWGALVVGGAFNADARYYTELSGVGEWRSSLGNIGNANRVEAYPGGDYALVVSWSGRSIYRFKSGEFSSYTEALRFSSMGIWDVSFQEDGRRALISGRASSNSAAGTMLEYRHDLYSCDNNPSPCADNAITDVSIWGFDDAPWQAQSNTYIFDTAFRPGCDGGILVGSYSTTSGNGFLGEFQIENGVDCRTE